MSNTAYESVFLFILFILFYIRDSQRSLSNRALGSICCMWQCFAEHKLDRSSGLRNDKWLCAALFRAASLNIFTGYIWGALGVQGGGAGSRLVQQRSSLCLMMEQHP